MPQWVTIPELIVISKKSDKTIRRLINRLRTTDKQLADHLKKSPTDSYSLERDYFLERLGATSHETGQEASQRLDKTGHTARQETSHLIRSKDEFIEYLKGELHKKDAELKAKNEQIIQAMSMLRGYQEKFFLEPINKGREGDKPLEPLGVSNPDGQMAGQETSQNAPRPSQKPKQPQKPVRKPKKTENVQPQKKGFWASLLGL